MSAMSETTQQITGRFAPSPSGRMHLGNAFSSLVAWASARSTGGRMVLRIEDLDPRTKDPELARQIIDDLAWLGLDWDEGPIRQSDRGEVYLEALERLKGLGLTYPCFCTRAELHAASAPHASDGVYIYQGTCRGLSEEQIAMRLETRPAATRLKVPEPAEELGAIDFDDLGWGPQHEVLARDCGDFLVRRSDGVIAYQLAVVVDDCLMGVNQVVRGRDLLSSSARQIYIAHLLGFTPPTYGHVPLLVAPDGRRLAKRDRDCDLGALREAGETPEKIIGRLAEPLGLAERGEPVSAQEFVERFSWDAVRSHRDDIVIARA